MECKEIIELVANIAVALGVLISAFIIGININALNLQRETYKADLFHNLSTEINKIFSEQIFAQNLGKEAVENWYERLIDSFEYFSFFANRELLLIDMAEYYKESVVNYCDSAALYSESLKTKLQNKSGNQFCEIKNYYEKYSSGKAFPLKKTISC